MSVICTFIGLSVWKDANKELWSSKPNDNPDVKSTREYDTINDRGDLIFMRDYGEMKVHETKVEAPKVEVEIPKVEVEDVKVEVPEVEIKDIKVEAPKVEDKKDIIVKKDVKKDTITIK